MSFDLKRLPDLTPLLAWGRPLAVGVSRFEAWLRQYPRIAQALDAVAATWATLVAAFCELIDPYLERFFPDLRLVAVAMPGGGLDLHRVTKDGVAALGPLAALDAEATAELQRAKWSAVELRLRPEQVLRRTLSLPGASRNFLGPIIEHRLERLTPWRQDKVLYGYRLVETDAATPGTVDVALVATSKDIVEGLVRQLADLKLAPTRIGASDGSVDQPMAIDLQTNGAAPLRSDSRLVVSRVAMAVLACLLIGTVVTASIASGAADHQEATGAKLLKARRLLKAASMANIGSREKVLLDAKVPDKAMVVLIDRLATAIPQNTYLKELAVTPDKVRIVGSSLDAPALVRKLEAAGLADVRFSAAVTREKDQRDSFEITADRAAAAPEAIDP